MRNGIKTKIADIIFEAVGSVFYGIGLICFVRPAGFGAGGVSGIALMLNHLFALPTGTVIFCINIPLLLYAWRSLGRVFTLRTLYNVLLSTVVMDNLITPFFPVYKGNPLLSAVFGGICVGIGLGLIFSRGTTTGGIDILGTLIERRYPFIPIGQALMLIDCLILAGSVFVYDNLEAALYGLIFIYFQGRVIDGIVYGAEKGKQILVISDKTASISRRVLKEMDRSATILYGQGAYLKKEERILMCVVGRHEFHELLRITREEDERAFVIISEVSRIIGEGFQIK